MPALVNEATRKRPTSISVPAPTLFLIKCIEQICKDKNKKVAEQYIKAIAYIGKELGINVESEDYKREYAEWLKQRGWDSEEPRVVASRRNGSHKPADVG